MFLSFSIKLIKRKLYGCSVAISYIRINTFLLANALTSSITASSSAIFLNLKQYKPVIFLRITDATALHDCVAVITDILSWRLLIYNWCNSLDCLVNSTESAKSSMRINIENNFVFPLSFKYFVTLCCLSIILISSCGSYVSNKYCSLSLGFICSFIYF